MPGSQRSRFWRRVFLAIVVFCLGWIGAIYWMITLQANRDESRRADAIVVFGAAEYSGRPSPIYRARLDNAYMLFKSGLAPLIITTGGAAEDPQFSEGGVGRDYLVSRGIPDGDIVAETQSSDTNQSAARVANILRANGFRTCLAVSDGYHMFRVKQMLEREGVVVYASPSPNSHLLSPWQRARVKLREVFSYTAWKLGM